MNSCGLMYALTSSCPLGFYEGERQRHELRADMKGVNVSAGIPNHVMCQCY